MENENKNLSGEQLEKVSGGESSRTIDGIRFWGHVGKYDAVVGQKYYITVDGPNRWYAGVLTKTWEATYCIFWSRRMHRFNLILENGHPYVHTSDFEGDNVTLYTHCSAYPD